MPWKRGKIKFDDGSVYPADLLLSDNGEVWNVKVYKDGNAVQEINAVDFADQLGKSVDQVYPFRYELE